jgi:GNAT superfamily N-acetyltransferase
VVEVVGTLVAATPETMTLRRRDGSLAEVHVDDVQAGRVVPPAPSAAVSVGELEAVAALGWRAMDTERLGPWLLRAAGGFTGRANSALVTSAPVDLDGALAVVRRWYADRGLPPRLQVPDGDAPPGLDAALDAAAWSWSPPTHVMTAEVAPVLRGSATDVDVEVRDEVDGGWLALYRHQEGPLPAVAAAVLSHHPAVRFISVRAAGECVAIARVCVDGRWAGISGVEVAPAHRRHGLGTAVTVAGLRWAVRAGARRAYLQVFAPNVDGVAFWQRLGFAVHHDYRYCVGNVDG